MRSNAAAPERNRHGTAADAVDLTDAIVAPLLSLVCSNADLRRRLRLKGASRRADGWPAWYFWFAGVFGAHELALIPSVASGDDAATTRTELAIRYFPHPDEDAVESFAPIEQATRRSTLFDATGTPAVEEFDTIEPSLFHVATLALSPSRALLNIDFAAQDCWLETDTADEAVAVRRAVRGFELGAPVLDLLIGAHTYYGRTPPRGVEILREPGLRWHVNGNGVAASTIAAEVSLLTVHVRGLLRYGAALGAEVTAEPTPPLVPSAGQACVFRHYGRDAPPHFDGLDLATWWRAAVWRFIPSGLFCGCQAEDLSIAGRDEADTCVAAHGQLKALP